MPNFTPGPLQVYVNYGPLQAELLSPDGGRAIATVWVREGGHFVDSPSRYTIRPWTEGEANLRLFQNAPEMAELLQKCEKVLHECDLRDAIEALLSKIERQK